MKRADYLWLSGLLVAALLIWLRDLAWVSAAWETLPVLTALPLFLWLGAPWQFRPEEVRWHQRALLAAGVLLGAGLATDLTLLLAGAWTLALWSWLRARVVANPVNLRRLLLLPLMAFPWLTLDLAPLGWWFRITAAWAAEHVFGALGFLVVRQGTTLLVHGLPIEVSPACSGMNSLQAVLVAGVVLAYLEFRGSRGFWSSLVLLPVLAWLANALRVCAMVALALSWGATLARGWLHDAGGGLVILGAFLGWWLAVRTGCRKCAATRAHP